MAVREIPHFAADAVNGGCFVNGGNSVKVRDPITRELRNERSFTFDRRVERHMYNKRIQIGERAVMELADKLGWISPTEAEAQRESIIELERALADAEARASEAETAADQSAKRLGTVVIQKEDAEEKADQLKRDLAKANGEKGALVKQIGTLKADLANTEFGDAE
jgi:chromosome segregation ATPase